MRRLTLLATNDTSTRFCLIIIPSSRDSSRLEEARQTNDDELIHAQDGTEQFAQPVSLVAHCWLHAEAVVGVLGASPVLRFPY